MDMVAAFSAVGAVVAIAVMPFLRRPRLSVHEDREGIHTRLEANDSVPWLRLLVRNARLVRAAQGTRALIVHYHENRPVPARVAMGNPELAWPSAGAKLGQGVVVFAGEDRPLDLAALEQSGSDELGGQVSRGDWRMRFTLAMHDLGDGRGLFIGREFLDARENGYKVRLLVGANDGGSVRYDVVVNWNPKAPHAAAALASVQLDVARVRWWRRD